MKKILFIITFFLSLTSCQENRFEIAYERGKTKKIIETNDYIITEIYDGCNAFGRTFWKLESIRRKEDVKIISQKDSI